MKSQETLHDERIVTVREETSLHVEHERDVTDGIEVASRGAQLECGSQMEPCGLYQVQR